MPDVGEKMNFSSGALISGLFGNEVAIFVALIVVGLVMLATFIVGLILLVLRNINRQWPVR
jgi:hypothetical protein